jgi:hypothetical protein
MLLHFGPMLSREAHLADTSRRPGLARIYLGRPHRRRLERGRDIVSTVRAQPEKWARYQVGTIHNFQGREAGTLILLLGAPNAGQHGARNWAGSHRSILIAAVTRVKRNLYVVGSFGAWSGIAGFNAMANLLAIKRVIQTEQALKLPENNR